MEGFQVTEDFIHLKNDSPFISLLHTNWRFKTVEQVKDNPSRGLHYSLCFTCEKKDEEKVKEVFLKALTKESEVIKPSKDEIVMALGIDLYPL